jgi:hypothetical protein
VKAVAVNVNDEKSIISYYFGIDDFQLHIVRRSLGVEAIDKLITERGVGFRNFCKFHCFSVLGYT